MSHSATRKELFTFRRRKKKLWRGSIRSGGRDEDQQVGREVRGGAEPGDLGAVCAAAAATLLVDSGGRLTGAAGVEVLGSFYDVAFLDGTCGAVFTGCDQTTDFAFTTFAGANAAAQALLDQVWIDGPAGQFDSVPILTAGCPGASAGASCFALIPFLPLNPTQAGGRQAQNRAGATPDNIAAFIVTPISDLTPDAGTTWARFTPSMAEAVPEPGTWAMLILGFGTVGAIIRRERRRLTLHA